MMHLEYQVTGTFRLLWKFVRLEGVGPWIQMVPEGQNDLK